MSDLELLYQAYLGNYEPTFFTNVEELLLALEDEQEALNFPTFEEDVPLIVTYWEEVTSK